MRSHTHIARYTLPSHESGKMPTAGITGRQQTWHRLTHYAGVRSAHLHSTAGTTRQPAAGQQQGRAPPHPCPAHAALQVHVKCSQLPRVHLRRVEPMRVKPARLRSEKSRCRCCAGCSRAATIPPYQLTRPLPSMQPELKTESILDASRTTKHTKLYPYRSYRSLSCPELGPQG